MKILFRTAVVPQLKLRTKSVLQFCRISLYFRKICHSSTVPALPVDLLELGLAAAERQQLELAVVQLEQLVQLLKPAWHLRPLAAAWPHPPLYSGIPEVEPLGH